MNKLIEIGLGIIDKILPDAAANREAKIRLLELSQMGELKHLDAAMNIIVAEATSKHRLTAMWRPITMLTFVAIIANNYLLYPYLTLFWNSAPLLELPPDLWGLLKIGLGGYVVGRSVEKSIEKYRA